MRLGVRYLADSNRRTRFCRPLPSHSAKVPWFCECKGRVFFLNEQIIYKFFWFILFCGGFFRTFVRFLIQIYMSFLGNLIWIIFGGLFLSLGYLILGLFYCCTIVGIPVGVQLFKLAGLALHPFGCDVEPRGGSLGAGSIVLNILWIIFGGLEMALAHLSLGLVFCVTIVGIPFGIQHFKLALLALLPFGNTVR